MAIFVIFKVAYPERVKAALASKFPGNYLELGSGEFLVSAKGTAKDISDKLDISDGNTGSAIVFRMLGYYGRATQETWDWIATNAEKTDG